MATKPSMAGQGLGLLGYFINEVRRILEETYKKSVHELERLADPELHAIVAAYLVGLPITIGKAIEPKAPIRNHWKTITISIDPKECLEKLIVLGSYRYIGKEIVNHLNPTLPRSAPIQDREILLLRIDKNNRSSSKDELRILELQGLRSATVQELLWVGLQHKNLGGAEAISVFSSFWKREDFCSSVNINTLRELSCDSYGGPWTCPCYLAVVRLSPHSTVEG